MVPPPGVAPAPSFPAAICLAGAPGSAELQTEKPLHPYQDYPHRGSRVEGLGTMSSTKRNNAQLDRSYKRARGIKDDRRGPKVDPNTILRIAFIAMGLKALNEHVKRTHGINAFAHGKRLAVDAIRDVRSAFSRMLAPKSGGGRGDRGRPNSRSFKGKGKRLGKR